MFLKPYLSSMPVNPGMIIRIMIYIIVFYIFACLSMYVLQRKFIYFCTPKIPHQYVAEKLVNAGETIEIIILNEGKKQGILYFGGNAEPVVYNGEEFSHLFPEHTVYLMNYRGYGGSTGNPEEVGICSDALALYDSISKRHSDLSVIGRSLGSGVATFLASKRLVEKLVLVTPFDSILDMGRRQFFIFPVKLLLKDTYNSIGRVQDIKAPTLALIAEYDLIVPKRHSSRLVQAFPSGQIRSVVIGGTGHNTISMKKDYETALQQFFGY